MLLIEATHCSTSLESVSLLAGAAGYVAGPIIHRLLAAGHTVHATVRSLAYHDGDAHLLTLGGASKRLKLFVADLLKEGSFDAAMEGSTYVIHTASPYIMKVGESHISCPNQQIAFGARGKTAIRKRQ